MEPSPAGVDRALAGDPQAVRAFVSATTPIVQARVARALLRQRRRSGARDVRQDVGDLVQEVFVALFENDGRALRAWRPEKGLSLMNFVGLVAEREVASILRSGRRSPWTEDPTESDALEAAGDAAPGPAPIDVDVVSRDFLERLLDRLRASVTPKGLQIFRLLFVEERGVEEICGELGMQADAVYAWRSRLGKLARALAKELDPASDPKLIAPKLAQEASS
jgi:RNA polymerase sigma-70 factor (ECF subfamily)